VDVKVGHALADPVVDGDEGSSGAEAVLHDPGQALHALEERAQLVGR
jgi:hypothetical protein